MATLETVSGRMVNVLDPRPEDICINDIAHALSMQARFGGHTRREYSVAEHSYWVSYKVPASDALQALLHDATEAYLCDIPTPIKRLFPDYYTMEERLWRVIAYKFGVPAEMSAEVKAADARMASTEKLELVGTTQNADHDVRRDFMLRYPPYDITDGFLGYESVPWYDARDLFLARFRELSYQK